MTEQARDEGRQLHQDDSRLPLSTCEVTDESTGLKQQPQESVPSFDWSTLDKLSDPICLIEASSANILACNIAFINMAETCNQTHAETQGTAPLNFLTGVISASEHSKVLAGIKKLQSCIYTEGQYESIGIIKMKKPVRSNEWFDPGPNFLCGILFCHYSTAELLFLRYFFSFKFLNQNIEAGRW